MAEQQVAMARGWFEEVWNQKQPEAMRKFIDDDTIIHEADETGAEARGPEGFLPFFRRLCDTLPDIEFTVEDAIDGGDRVTLRWIARATHTGDGLGVPATNAKVIIKGMSIARFENGRVKEAWNCWDRLALATACGLVAPTGAAQR
jgi:steroid delta-isomerase-like uncharacterized protein